MASMASKGSCDFNEDVNSRYSADKSSNYIFT